MEDMIVMAIDKLNEHFPEDRHVLKVIEECSELSEVLTKYLTRSEGNKPSKERIAEEMGDVIFRVMSAAQCLKIEDEVEQRVESKAKELYEWCVKKFETKV